MARPYIWKWTARIKRDSLPLLQALAGGLGFIIDTPGAYQGEPSAPAMLDALATAYRVDPGGTDAALRVLLDINNLLPPRPSAANVELVGRAHHPPPRRLRSAQHRTG